MLYDWPSLADAYEHRPFRLSGDRRIMSIIHAGLSCHLSQIDYASSFRGLSGNITAIFKLLSCAIDRNEDVWHRNDIFLSSAPTLSCAMAVFS
jgi:hypothetical protein